MLRRVLQPCLQHRDPEALRALFDQRQLVRMDVAGEDASLIAHLHRRGEALAAGGRAGVQHLHPRLHAGGQRRQMRGRILNVDASVPEGIQPFEIPGSLSKAAVRQPRVRRQHRARLLQLRKNAFRVRPKRVCVQDRRRDLIVAFQQRFDGVLSHTFLQKLDQLLRMAVFRRQIRRLRQRVSASRHRAQQPVDESRRAPVRIALALLDRLIDRRRHRDLIQKYDLERAQPQDIQHDRLKLPQLPVQEVRNIKIQQHPVLQHAVAEPAGQRRVARIEPVAGDILLQDAVRPCILPSCGDQRRQRRRSSIHVPIP